MALSGHEFLQCECLLSGVKQGHAVLRRKCLLLTQTRHEFVSDGTTYYRAARKTAIPVVNHAAWSAAVICSSTRPLVSMPTAHSAIEGGKKLSAKACTT